MKQVESFHPFCEPKPNTVQEANLTSATVTETQDIEEVKLIVALVFAETNMMSLNSSKFTGRRNREVDVNDTASLKDDSQGGNDLVLSSGSFDE